MHLETLLVIFVAFSALAFGIQSFFMIRAARSLAHWVKNLDKQVKQLEEGAQELMNRTQRVAESLEPLSRIAEKVNVHAELIFQMVETRARDLDQLVEEMINLGREQASKVDQVMTDTVQKFEQATEIIQKDVVQPAAEVSSFLKGIKAGFSYLSQRKSRSKAEEDYPEEELFI